MSTEDLENMKPQPLQQQQQQQQQKQQQSSTNEAAQLTVGKYPVSDQSDTKQIGDLESAPSGDQQRQHSPKPVVVPGIRSAASILKDLKRSAANLNTNNGNQLSSPLLPAQQFKASEFHFQPLKQSQHNGRWNEAEEEERSIKEINQQQRLAVKLSNDSINSVEDAQAHMRFSVVPSALKNSVVGHYTRNDAESRVVEQQMNESMDDDVIMISANDGPTVAVDQKKSEEVVATKASIQTNGVNGEENTVNIGTLLQSSSSDAEQRRDIARRASSFDSVPSAKKLDLKRQILPEIGSKTRSSLLLDQGEQVKSQVDVESSDFQNTQITKAATASVPSIAQNTMTSLQLPSLIKRPTTIMPVVERSQLEKSKTTSKSASSSSARKPQALIFHEKEVEVDVPKKQDEIFSAAQPPITPAQKNNGRVSDISDRRASINTITLSSSARKVESVDAMQKRLRSINKKSLMGGRTRLHRLANQSRVEEVAMLIQDLDELGDPILDVSLPDNSNVTTFHFACMRGCAGMLEMLLHQQESYFEREFQPKMLASNASAVKLCVDGMCKTDYTGTLSLHLRDVDRFDTPLHDIVVGLFHAIGRVLANDINDQGKLTTFVMEHDLRFSDCARLLLSHGYNTKMLNRKNLTAAELLEMETHQLLQQHSDVFETATGLMQTLLQQIDEIHSIVEAFEDKAQHLMYKLDKQGRSLLHFIPLSLTDNLDDSNVPFTNLLQLLTSVLRSGVDIGQQDVAGMTTLHYAVSSMNLPMVYYLCCLSNVTSRPFGDGKGLQFSRRAQLELLQNSSTALSDQQHDYANGGKIVPELVSIVSVDNETPLHLCVKAINYITSNSQERSSKSLLDDSYRIGRTLIIAGVNVDVRNAAGQKALDACENLHFVDEMRQLIHTLVKGSLIQSGSVANSSQYDVKKKNKGKAVVKAKARRSFSQKRQRDTSVEPNDREVELKSSAKKSKVSTNRLEGESTFNNNGPDSLEVADESVIITEVRPAGRSRRAPSIDVTASLASSSKPGSKRSNISNRSAKKYSDNLDPLKLDVNGRSRLHFASREGSLEKVNILISRGANVNCEDYAGYTPLSEAANNGHYAILKVLLEEGANPNVHGIEGETPLQEAVKGCDPMIVKLLLEFGADPFSTNLNGMIARDYLQDAMSSPLPRISNLQAAREQIRHLLDNHDLNKMVAPISKQSKDSQFSDMANAVSIDIKNPKVMVEKKINKRVPSTDGQSASTIRCQKPPSLPPIAQNMSQYDLPRSVQQPSLQLVQNADSANFSVKDGGSVASHNTADQLTINEAMLPMQHYLVNGQEMVLDIYVTQLLGFASTTRMYLYFGKDTMLRQQIKSSRQTVDAAQLMQIPYAPTGKSFWIPVVLFEEQMVSFFADNSGLDPLDLAALLDEKTLSIIK